MAVPSSKGAVLTPDEQAKADAVRTLAAQRALERQRKASAAAQGVGTNLTVFQRILSEDAELAHLSREQIEAYLVRHQTNAATLLTAWQAGGGRDYLKRAAELFPDDPRVQLAVLNMNMFPDQQREWLDRLKKSDPENPMGNYLSARDYLLNGKPELALKELGDARGKTKYEDYAMARLQDFEELQMEAGHSAAEAKAIAGSGLLLPQLAQMKDVARQLGNLQEQYLAAGDLAGAQQLALLGQGASRELSEGSGGANFLINQLVGLAMERILISKLPHDSQPDFLGMTVQERMTQIEERKAELRTHTPLFNEMIARGNEAEMVSYFDRVKLNGENAALKWLAGRTPQH